MKKLTYEERVRQRMPKPKRPSRKFVLIEVETTLSNAHLSDYVQLNLNYDVFVYGMHRWTLPAVRVLLNLEPTAPEAARAREIQTFFGAPKSWDDSCWWALN